MERVDTDGITPLCGDHDRPLGQKNKIRVRHGIPISARCHQSEWAKLLYPSP